MGMGAFAKRAAAAGVDGVIVPDLSLEESAAFRAVLDDSSVDHIQLVAPSTTDARARAIGAATRSLLYVVARYGTTGTRAALPQELGARLASLHNATPLPLAVGFGISSPEHVRDLASLGADGVVVGSAIVRRIGIDPSPAVVESFVAELSANLRRPPTHIDAAVGREESC